MLFYNFLQASLVVQTGGKESACKAGDSGSIPVSGRSSGEGNGNPLQYSCLENSMDRGAWQAKVHRVAGSDTTEQLTPKHTHTHFLHHTQVTPRRCPHRWAYTTKNNSTVHDTNDWICCFCLHWWGQKLGDFLSQVPITRETNDDRASKAATDVSCPR